MKKFAIIENGKVINTIVAETATIVEELFAGKQYVEFTDDQENKPVMGLKYENGIFEQPVSEILIEDNDTIVEDAVAEDTPTE
jgi:hypothetical protein